MFWTLWLYNCQSDVSDFVVVQLSDVSDSCFVLHFTVLGVAYKNVSSTSLKLGRENIVFAS